MKKYQMGAIESRFADIIWQNEPINTAELARRSSELLGWKKSTSYTVLTRLCDKGIFKNNRGTVTSLLSKQEFYALQSEQFVDDTFNGSLPAFIAAFVSHRGLSADEAEQLRRIVDGFKEE